MNDEAKLTTAYGVSKINLELIDRLEKETSKHVPNQAIVDYLASMIEINRNLLISVLTPENNGK